MLWPTRRIRRRQGIEKFEICNVNLMVENLRRIFFASFVPEPNMKSVNDTPIAIHFSIAQAHGSTNWAADSDTPAQFRGLKSDSSASPESHPEEKLDAIRPTTPPVLSWEPASPVNSREGHSRR